MTDLRDWVARRLEEEDEQYESRSVGRRGLMVLRRRLPNARVYCADADSTQAFTATDLNVAATEMPDLQFVTIIRRSIGNDVYTIADELGVAIGGFPALTYALHSSSDVGQYRSATNEFVASRLTRSPPVSSWRRLAYSCYEIERLGKARSLVALMVDGYEITADEIYTSLETHSELDVDVLVATNPNCRGFSRVATKAASDAGVELVHFRDFLPALRGQWKN